jgi:hypothetical protein
MRAVASVTLMRVANWTDLPGDQLTGTLPIGVHAGRSALLARRTEGMWLLSVIAARMMGVRYPPSACTDVPCR